MSTGTINTIVHSEIKIKKVGKKFCSEFECWSIDKPKMKIKTTVWGNSEQEVSTKVAHFLGEPA